ncbi:P-loop NTPase [Candidatus Halobonum tyrrellensis]|uniref:CobQ/CobB/MinD/ParA nucleotide binding domain-containing protein n=1 Tax=Candidatus Halobonum tyrrellensis G22 TaxID=1324957 RepID=V4J1C7_9EURY|nr:P-loop NTPase [Candidatus Halobonum tyrrellensis]ESP89252.1 hypothetical protein K933_04521 [Candidatus Halobonum tyrrellensis G22]
MPTMYAVASAKGGVGKTTTAANLAAALAAAGHTTVVVDGDLGTPNLAATLGVEVPEGGATLHDVLAGEADPVEATYEGPDGLAVMPGGRTLDAFRAADPSGITEAVGAVTGAEYVVVDTGAGVTHESVLPLSVADGVVLASTPTRNALADTSRTLELAERLGGHVVGLTLTRVGADGVPDGADGGVDPSPLDVPVLGRVPEDPVVEAAAAAGEPLSAFAPDSDAAAAYRAVASALVDIDAESSADTAAEPFDDTAAEPSADTATDADDADDTAADPAATDLDPVDADADAGLGRRADAAPTPAPRSVDGDVTPAIVRLDATADGGSGAETAAGDAVDGDTGSADDAPAPRSLDDGAPPAITPLDDADAVVDADPADGDADAVDAPRTVLGEVVEGPVAGVDDDTEAGDAPAGGGLLGRLFR